MANVGASEVPAIADADLSRQFLKPVAGGPPLACQQWVVGR
jgi:hypothetical protein